MREKVKIKLVFIFVSLILLSISRPLLADNSSSKIIYWQTYHRPPGIMKIGEHKGKGFVQLVLNQITQRMPDYQHRTPATTLARALQDMKAGKQVCHPALFATAEREKFIHFSKNVMLNPTNRVIMRETMAQKHQFKQVNLGSLLTSPEFTFTWVQGRSFGKDIDSIISVASGKERVETIPSNSIASIFHIVSLGRADITIAYPFELAYFSDHYEGHGEKLVVLPIADVAAYTSGKVACSKTDWGAKVVSRVNEVLTEIRHTPEYLESMTTWWQEERESELFQHYYQNDFLTN